MVSLKPFKGTRPFNEDAINIIAPSTDHLSEENIDLISNKNYWNYLKILNPVGQLKESETLLASKNHFNEMKKNEVIKQDDRLSFYIYQISQGNHTQLGFLALANINDFLCHKIKGHENTQAKRMNERADQMTNIETQIGPIYVSYPDDNKINELLESFTSLVPDYDFESFDHSHHKLWCISNPKDIKMISKQLKSINSLYIADGHHRMEAMNIISQNYKKQKNNCDSFMIAAFPAEQTKIYDFLDKLKENFKVTISDSSFKPKSKRQFGMYHHGKWYSLEFIGNFPDENDILSLLDINILNNYCLIPILGIKDINNDERIRFIAGCHGLTALENKVNKNYDSVAFSIFPSHIEEVMRVADNKLTMPPKSTWFDPKPLDGLVVYEFNQDN
ncbi:MAG TPA: DUF1015 domain-containing protein [Candidatus Thioglobus sp.]|nr:DUF1015 domain-containing protein [Candidatus Thioglobus sp.]